MKLIRNTKLALVLSYFVFLIFTSSYTTSTEVEKARKTDSTKNLTENDKKLHSFRNSNKSTKTHKNALQNQSTNTHGKNHLTANSFNASHTSVSQNTKKGKYNFYQYDPDNVMHLLILDNSISLRNRFNGKHISRRLVMQKILNGYGTQGKSVSYCVASPLSLPGRKRIILKYLDEPPKLKVKSTLSFLGIRKCLERVAKLESKIGFQVFSHIHIVTDGYYRELAEFKKPIKRLLKGKTFSADVIGNNEKSITTIKNWIKKANGVNKGIRFKFDKVFKDEAK